MFKKRTRNPNARLRQHADALDSLSGSISEPKSETEEQTEDGPKLGLDDIIQLRKLRRTREGIDATKLVVGEKRKRAAVEENVNVTPSGLSKPMLPEFRQDDADSGDEEAMTRKLVRSNNFTQQTNTLDVDKHMMEYIEKELQKKKGADGKADLHEPKRPYDPYEELFRVDAKYKAKGRTEAEEGGVTTSMAMLTAIPEVDLGMETRLRNIEETEKAKREAADSSTKRRRTEEDDGLAALRFLRRTQEEQSPAVALMNARLEAQGFAPTPPKRDPVQKRPQTATDEQALERFKKRMRQ